ncbi:MAG: hypothetical protein IPF52_14335 [Saprospiraceae bacterium]|nr:hypothetical protein [Saprospiraceae bacterium]
MQARPWLPPRLSSVLGGTVDLSVSGHIDDPYYNQYLWSSTRQVIIVHVYEGTSSDFTFPNCGEFTFIQSERFRTVFANPES